MTTWKGIGLQMIIFLAGLQAIPNELYEAAAVDGATRWHRFRYVTLPMLRPTLLFSTVVASIGLLQVFEEPFVMTQGGPLDSTLTVAFHAYNQFSFGNYGYTAAIAYVLFLVIAGLTMLQFRLLPRADVTGDDDDRPRSIRRQRIQRRRPADPRRRSVGLHVALIAGLVVMIVPFVWMILSSFKLTAGTAPLPDAVDPRGTDSCRTTGTCSTASTSRATSSTRRSSLSSSPPATCCSARCSATPWPSSSFPASASCLSWCSER